MKVNAISRTEFFQLIKNHKKSFLESIALPEAYIVKKFYSEEFVTGLRNSCFNWGQAEDASWHPFYDDCPDYHRLHDNYPKAYVKQKFHGFYHHNYVNKNKDIFSHMRDIFLIKNKLAGFKEEEFLENIPSDGIVPRINVHHYPRGGGYQSEHIDPDGPFAQIQTLIAGSKYGVDFKTGGLFARKNKNSEKFYLDSYTDIGDMIVISPAIFHGVDPIDPDVKYSPDTNDGRWILLPLFLYSDYPNEKNIKPKQV
ncbi:MAG: hypothetical protein WD048_07185 [Chitinophagales bacterium]